MYYEELESGDVFRVPMINEDLRCIKIKTGHIVLNDGWSFAGNHSSQLFKVKVIGKIDLEALGNGIWDACESGGEQ